MQKTGCFALSNGKAAKARTFSEGIQALPLNLSWVKTWLYLVDVHHCSPSIPMDTIMGL